MMNLPEGFQLLPEAQNAIEAGANPSDVLAHQLKIKMTLSLT